MWYELIPAPDTVEDDKSFQDRANRAAAALGLASRPSVLNPSDWGAWLRREDGMLLAASGDRRWIRILDGDERTVKLVARAAHATFKPCDEPDILDDPDLDWAHAIVPPTASLARTAKDEQSSDDNVRLDIPDDTVVVFNVRRLGWKESKRVTDWLADEFNRQADTSKLRATGLGATRIMAGAPDVGDATDLVKEAANSLNLGLTTGASAHRSMPRLGRRILGPLLLLASIPLLIMGAPLPLSILLTLAGVACVVSGFRPGLPVWEQRPRHRWWRTRMRKAESGDLKTAMAGDDQNADSKKQVHAYAFQRSTFPLPPGALAAVCTPPARRRGRVSELTERPDALQGADGPILGVDANGVETRMWRAASYGGIMLFGEPGGGKSNLMHGIMGGMASQHRTGDLLVAFESKGADSIPILHRLIPRLRVIDLNDPHTPMIGLLGDGTPEQKAGRFADLMRRALGDEQVGARSRIQIRDAVLASLIALDDPDFPRRCLAKGVDAPDDWVTSSARLLGSEGIRDARALGQAASRADTRAAACIERLHGPVRENGQPQIRDGDLANMLQAPMNKLDLLAQAPVLYRADRPTLTFAQVTALSASRDDMLLVVNLGPAVTPAADGSHPAMPDDTRRLVGALLFRGLKDQVERSCAGWQEQNRHVRLFVDELADVLGGTSGGDKGGNADIFEWFRERGRGFGVELVLGSQNPLQLDDRLLASVTGFQTVGSFVLRTPVTALPAAQAVGVEPERIMSLPRYAIAVRTPGAPPDLASQPPMILHVPYFDDTNRQ